MQSNFLKISLILILLINAALSQNIFKFEKAVASPCLYFLIFVLKKFEF